MPSRFEAQSDAVQLVFTAKTQSNPENSVGLISMSGSKLFCSGNNCADYDDRPEVLVTLTNEIGKVLVALHTLKIGGKSHLSHAIQVAQVF